MNLCLCKQRSKNLRHKIAEYNVKTEELEHRTYKTLKEKSKNIKTKHKNKVLTQRKRKRRTNINQRGK